MSSSSSSSPSSASADIYSAPIKIIIDALQESIRREDAADGPRDALCQLKPDYLLHNCSKNLYNKSRTNRSNGVRGLQSSDLRSFDNFLRPATTCRLS